MSTDNPNPAVGGVPTRNVLLEDFGWEVPVETIPIPSEGKVYSKGSPLYNLSTIDIRAMTANEEDILTSRALIKKGTVITSLIRACVIDKSVDISGMLSGDRNALMVAIRVTGYGPQCKAEVNCPACGERSAQEFDLGSLPIKRLKVTPVNEGENIFSFNLPVTKQDIHFRFLTGKDEEEISIENTRMQKMFPDRETDNLVTARLENCIISVGGVTDRNKVRKFVKNMPAFDSRKLRTYMDKNEPGIEMKSRMLCPHCDTGSEVELPLGAGFFWPRD